MWSGAKSGSSRRWATRNTVDQNTDGSNSIRSFYDPLRIAGATAQTMLIGAAAAKWGVPAGECKAVKGVVHSRRDESELWRTGRTGIAAASAEAGDAEIQIAFANIDISARAFRSPISTIWFPDTAFSAWMRRCPAWCTHRSNTHLWWAAGEVGGRFRSAESARREADGADREV